VLQRKGSLFLTRPTLAHYVASRSELLRRTEEVMSWVRDGSLRVRIDRRLPLGAAAEAHAELEGRRTTGNVLLAPLSRPPSIP
jgi:NADPH2:quinone reductase